MPCIIGDLQDEEEEVKTIHRKYVENKRTFSRRKKNRSQLELISIVPAVMITRPSVTSVSSSGSAMSVATSLLTAETSRWSTPGWTTRDRGWTRGPSTLTTRPVMTSWWSAARASAGGRRRGRCRSQRAAEFQRSVTRTMHFVQEILQVTVWLYIQPITNKN